MSEQAENTVILTLAKGATAQLRTLADKMRDREIARVIYTELMQIVRKMEERYGFGREKR